ncbi:helix-turn-helix transcriptional regulator [Vibrio diabolicus]|uniref:helix-turn-helix transcriptional regulator n=1 Tax=Vibrio diabolicus TaxID=50719 RepID=UPI002119CC54|nr:hypothetical protein [Vibrio diabolicus]MCE3218309.1 hypothetical protein [Vibrio diabolicus]MCQ9065853.1 hypothetical protein [Vibrio diabolicus]MDV5035146.1 hypothetical protein [Vibrio diabolicus]
MSSYDHAALICSTEKRFIKKQELAVMLNCSVRTIHRMVKNKELTPPIRTPKGYIRGWCAKDIDKIFVRKN